MPFYTEKVIFLGKNYRCRYYEFITVYIMHLSVLLFLKVHYFVYVEQHL